MRTKLSQNESISKEMILEAVIEYSEAKGLSQR
jgi:hypothetical protein